MKRHRLSAAGSTGPENACGCRLLRRADASGQGMTEYIIIAIVVGVAVLLAARYFGGSIGAQFTDAKEEITGLKKGEERIETAVVGEERKTTPGEGGHQSGQNLGGATGGVAPPPDENGPGGSSSGPGSEYDALRSPSVGDPSSGLPELSWRQIFQVAGIVVLFGILIVFLGFRKKGGKNTKKEKKKAKKEKKKKGSAGQAMVEFIFVAVTFLFAILGVLQLAMILNAGYAGDSLMTPSMETDKMRRTGGLDGEYRFSLVAHSTMPLQSDYQKQ